MESIAVKILLELIGILIAVCAYPLTRLESSCAWFSNDVSRVYSKSLVPRRRIFCCAQEEHLKAFLLSSIISVANRKEKNYLDNLYWNNWFLSCKHFSQLPCNFPLSCFRLRPPLLASSMIQRQLQSCVTYQLSHLSLDYQCSRVALLLLLTNVWFLEVPGVLILRGQWREIFIDQRTAK